MSPVRKVSRNRNRRLVSKIQTHRLSKFSDESSMRGCSRKVTLSCFVNSASLLNPLRYESSTGDAPSDQGIFHPSDAGGCEAKTARPQPPPPIAYLVPSDRHTSTAVTDRLRANKASSQQARCATYSATGAIVRLFLSLFRRSSAESASSDGRNKQLV